MPWAVGVAVGLIGGLISAISNSGGLLFTVYLLAVGLRKEAYIATLVCVFFAQNLVEIPLYIGAGIIGWQALILAAAMIPVVWAGGWLGKQLVTRMSSHQHGGIVGGQILLAGIISLFR